MYTLFNNPRALRQTNITAFGLDYVKRELMDTQVDRYRRYRDMNPGFLRSDHILVRLLNMIDVPFRGDLPEYYLQVGSIVNRLAGQMGFCNAAHRGRVLSPGHFYGKGVSEILIAIEGDSDIADVWYNWRQMSALRVLSHPVYGCDILELDGSNALPDVPSGAIAVIEVDIPLLACQYQLWKLVTSTGGSEAGVAPVQHFLTQVVIPNLLISHLDVAVLNSVHHLMGATDLVRGSSDMPFYTTDLWPRLSKGLGEILDRFSKQTLFYQDILSNVPVFGQDSLIQTVAMPDIAYTNQAIWALTIARLRAIALLLELDERNNNRKNDADKNRIRRSLMEADSGKYLINQIPKDVSTYVNTYIDEYIRPHL